MNVSGPLFGLLILVATLPISGCDPVEPIPRLPISDSVTLYSLARAEYLGEYSGYDFARPLPVLIELPRSGGSQDFDVAFSEDEGEFVLLPAGIFETFQIKPGIKRDSSGVTFDELSRAPKDGFITDAPVPLEVGGIYIVRTRRSPTGCTQYAKLEVLELDPAGILEFFFMRNNRCNDRDLTDEASD